MKNNLKLVTLGGLVVLAGLALTYSPSQDCCGGMMGGQHDKHHAEKPVVAKVVKGKQVATVSIDGGYKPGAISVKAGMPVELTFERKDSSGCSEILVIKDLKFKKSIPTGKKEVVKFTPNKPGEIVFQCGMAMLKGKIIVIKA